MNYSQRDDLVKKLQGQEGTLEQAEAWLDQLKRIDPYFYDSDAMLYLDTAVRARRKFDELKASLGERLNRNQLRELIENLCTGKGDDVEQAAWVMLIDRNVPHPNTIGLIFETDLTPDEIMDQALSYKPVVL